MQKIGHNHQKMNRIIFHVNHLILRVAIKVITIDENESAISVCRRVLSGSGTDERFQETKTSLDGTVWTKIAEGGTSGRSSSVFSRVNIITGDLVSAFSLIIDNYIIKHIKQCTEEEGSQILGYDWTTSLPKIRDFTGILYARGAYEAKNLKLTYLWSAKKT
ncbi:uncharacterized protein LOC113383712 [Ctenocephalides felis]|uniref:uncharacterized protein LOC113383712 n=1 Tax=Ctenocephalides felis TaxID=7515 RepID=UPI000E6E532C|nr:uncharacterized protein LOC113383712 [Ctenocephalides felis]